MTPADAAHLLALVAAFDRRTIGETDAVAWADALDGYTPDECAEAVRDYFRNSDAWLMPTHVRAIVKAKRADLADRAAAYQHHQAIAAVPYEQSAAHKAYLEASKVLQAAMVAKYERLGQPMPEISAHPFRRWTPRAGDAAKAALRARLEATT
jgi:hypothetical protein